MVLKIAYEGGWRFIDKIKEVFVTPVNISDFANNKEQNRNFDEVFFTNLKISGNEIIPILGQEPLDSRVCQLTVLMNNDEHKQYLADLAIYLLSDEGKTIERIG